MGTARVAIALVVCLLRQATALSVATAASPLQAIQSLDAHLQSQLCARYGSLAAAGAAAEGVGVWRGCFLKGRVPDDAFDGAAWPSDAGARSRCQRAFAPVARVAGQQKRAKFPTSKAPFSAVFHSRVVGRHPRLAPPLRALVEAALEDDAGAEAAALRSVVDGVGALEVYGDGADAVVDAVLEAEDLAALLGTAASSGAGRFQRARPSRPCGAARTAWATWRNSRRLAPLGRRATAASGASRSRGLRVAGLLVGRSRRGDGLEHAAPGSPFDALCDGVHTFLADHDDLALLMGASARPPPSTTALAAAAAPAGAAPPAFPVAPADLEAAAAHLERGLVERSAEARLVLLGAVGREHVLFVGPPGVAKSLLCRRLGELFGGPSFEIALTRFTTPDDVFGPLSLAALKDDAYRRGADGFAQEAPAVFFDEIFRARSLLPALLALLNERVWQDGPRRRPAALVSAVAGANTLGGDDDDDDDDALYDRFLIRREVAPVSDAAVADLLLGDDVDGACPLALAPLLAVPKPPRAALPRFFAELFGDARAFLRDRGDYVSDRRLRKRSRPSPRAARPPSSASRTGRAVAEGRELPDDDDEFAAAPRAAPAPAPGDDDDFDLTMSKKKAKKELTAAEFRRWTAARADLRG
ncbi:hypothetical protein JL722_13288 [Aureococcus anophagefferens]|nr:hypothetical protein JL722_13288 [Aureococcus anophagefferens]